jgi:glycosyltransferase involved in cell wall biosynthesis
VDARTRQPLSVTIIALNAARPLRACLESVRFADEIVIVDSGSTDDTATLAREFGARFLHEPWQGFGKQKQLAVAAATHDWILAIDTDERVSESLRHAIEAALRAPQSQVYVMARCNRFMGRWLRHGEGYPDWSTRLFHRGSARWSDDAVHERIVTNAAVARLAGDLLHESAESLESYLAKQDRYTSLAAQAIVHSGERVSLARLALSPLTRFLKFYVLRRGFLDGVPGLVHIAIGCWTSFLKYAKAWAIQHGAAELPAARDGGRERGEG